MSIPKVPSDPNKIQWRIDEWFPEIPETVRGRLKLYHGELMKVNKSFGLVLPKTIPSADAIHFADPILAWRVIEKDNKFNEIYDVGSGGGFPGLVFALLSPGKRFHLVESDLRKAEFLKQIILTLRVENADVIVKSIETFPPDSVNCAVCRSFLPLSRSLLVARKIFATKGVFYHLKGDEWAGEISSLPTQLCSYWQPGLLGEYKLPGPSSSETRLAVIRTEKT